MLPRFSDLKLTKLYETDPITVDLNQLNNESDISIVVPYQEIKRFRDMCVVLFWQAEYNTVTMNSNDVWFGNVNKQLAQANQDIVFRYDPQIHNWRLTYWHKPCKLNTCEF